MSVTMKQLYDVILVIMVWEKSREIKLEMMMLVKTTMMVMTMLIASLFLLLLLLLLSFRMIKTVHVLEIMADTKVNL